MEHTLALPHGTLAWESWGSSRADTTLVLIHGFPHDRWLWHAQAAAVATSLTGTRLLIPDLPGFGTSSALAAADMDMFADAIAALLDEAGVRQAVIGGLSMGGYIALAFWRRHPTRVRALMLLDTKAPADTDAAREKRREMIAAVTTDGIGPLVPGLLTQQLGATTRETQPALVEQVAVMLRRAPAAGVVAAAGALMTRNDSTPTLPTISVPTLVIVGEEDAVTPLGDALAMSAAIPGSRLVTIPGAGHLAPLEQPDVVNAAIAEFLDVAVRNT